MPGFHGEISDFNESRKEEINHTLTELVRSRSINPPGNESGPSEIVSRELTRFGIRNEILDHGNNRKSVVGIIPGAGTAGSLMMNGHLDTVPVGEEEWLHGPFSGDVEDGFLWGRGAVDMKGGDTAILYAAAAIASLGIPLKGDLLVSFAAGEEVDGIGADALASSKWLNRVDKMLIAEPSDLNIYVAEKGTLWLKFTASGKSAHGSMPEKGINAINYLSDLLQLLRDQWDGLFSTSCHPLLGKATQSVNCFQGGFTTNVVADKAEARVDIRTLPGMDHEELLNGINDAIRKTCSTVDELSIVCQPMNNRVPYEIAHDEPMVTELEKVISGHRGEVPEKKGCAFYTDASIFWPRCRLPIVICGPGESHLMHQANERIALSEVYRASKIFAEWAVRML